MKQLTIIILAVAAGATLMWFFQNRSHNETPEKSPQKQPANIASGATNPVSPVPAVVPAPASATPSAADKAVAALTGQIVVSLGKIEDVGRQAGMMLIAQKELASLQAIDAAARTPEQSRRLLELERQRAGTLGALPEIEHFQDNPDEYAGFFGALLRQAGGLDPAQTKTVSEYMRGRGQAMINSGLNAAKEPADPAQEEAWEARRDAFNEQTAQGVAGLLPPGEAERIGFTSGFLELMEQDFDKAK